MISRGQIYLVNLNPVHGREQKGMRPVLVVSADAINRQPLVVTVVAGTYVAAFLPTVAETVYPWRRIAPLGAVDALPAGNERDRWCCFQDSATRATSSDVATREAVVVSDPSFGTSPS